MVCLCLLLLPWMAAAEKGKGTGSVRMDLSQ
jgi:hypothetical protein